MKVTLKGALALSAAAMLTACASPPKNNAALDEARAMYRNTAADPQVARSAAIELQKAQAALTQAESALNAGAEPAAVEHYAYLASRRTEAAREAAKIAAADAAIRAAQSQRSRILVDARTREADAQRERAQQSLSEAEAARRRAEEEQARAEAARTRAAQQAAQTQSARAAAAAAKDRAAQLARELEALQAKQTERGIVLTMQDVLFDTGEAVLKPGAQRVLDQLAAFLAAHPERTVMIEGHTDSIGSADYNQVLSERRALAVRNALVTRGVEANRITSRGFGEQMPLVGNDTAAGRQQNRRVDIVLPDVG